MKILQMLLLVLPLVLVESCGKSVFSAYSVSLEEDGKKEHSTYVKAAIGTSPNVFTNIGDIYSLQIQADFGSVKYIQILLHSDKECKPGEYFYEGSYLNDFKELDIEYTADMLRSFYKLDDNNVQSKVTLESIDYRIGGRAKGTFSLRLINDTSNDVIEITNGKFDVLIKKP